MTSSLDFEGLAIAYDDTVLAPRPWTAAQSRWAADLAADRPAGPLLELCTGVGHIGLLAASLAGRDLVAVDASARACELLRANAAAAGVAVDVRQALLDRALAPEERFEVVLADPPWVPTHEVGTFPEDPVVAIDGGDDGLALTRMCLRVIADHLAPGGRAVLQVGPDQGDRVAGLLDDGVGDLGALDVTEVRGFPRGALVRLDRRA